MPISPTPPSGRKMSSSAPLFFFVTEYLQFADPFASARLSDEDLSLDFATCTTPSDRVAVIATAPLTCNEQWTAFASGELLVFQDGQRCA